MPFRFWKDKEKGSGQKTDRKKYLDERLELLMKYNPVVDSLEEWFKKLKIWIPDLNEDEVEYCKTYLLRRGGSGWDRWKES